MRNPDKKTVRSATPPAWPLREQRRMPALCPSGFIHAAILCVAALLTGSGCLVAGATDASATQVLYLITNRSGVDITFDLEINGQDRQTVSLATDESKLFLDDCDPIDEFRMTVVCAPEGASCNNLGIIISPDEVQCGNVVDVYVDPATDGPLILSAFLRNSDGTPGEQQDTQTDSTTPAGSNSSTGSTTATGSTP